MPEEDSAARTIVRATERATGRARERAHGLAVAGPGLLALALSLLLLGPALAPGFVLTYDMVWVPDLDLGLPALGLGTALPRAVPSDAVVAVLDEVVPGMWLQKLVLVSSLAGGAPAVARLVPGPAAARAVAVTFWVWNPFVVERLLLGAWPVLVAYAVLPWILLHGARWRRGHRGDDGGGSRGSAAWLLLLAPLGSLSPSAGLMTCVALAVSLLGARPSRARRGSAALWIPVVLAAQAPWIVSGLLHAGAAAPGVPGFEIFAPSSEGFGSPLLAALSFGGVWNTEVVPASRSDLRGVAYAVVLLALAAVGAVRARRQGRGESPWRALVLCWAVGFGLVALTTFAAGSLDAAARAVPGLALLRDGSRLLGLCVPLLAVAAGVGAGVLCAAVASAVRSASRVAAAVAGLVCVLAPLALLPDAAAGAGGRLEAVDYPAAYADLPARTARALPQGSRARDGATLVLPLSTYRAPVWNDGRPVLDPVPRLVVGDVVSGGGLVVSGTLLPGEDPREQDAAAALRTPGDAAARRTALEEIGVGAVVVDGSAPGGAAALRALGLGQTGPAGGPQVLALRPPADAVRAVPGAWEAAMAAAWSAYAGCLLLGILGVVGAAYGATRSRRGDGRSANRR